MQKHICLCLYFEVLTIQSAPLRYVNYINIKSLTLLD